MAEEMGLNVQLAMESQSFQQQLTIVNREMKLAQAEFGNASSALGDFGSEQQKLELKSASLTQQIQMSQQKVDLLTAAHERAKSVLAANVTINEDLRQSVTRATDAYNASVTATGETSAESQQLRTALDALNGQYTASNALILRNATTTDNLNIRLQNTQTAQNRLQNELTATNTDLEAQRNGMDGLGQSTEENRDKFKVFGERLVEMGKLVAVGIAAMGAAFGAAVTGGVKMGDDLQKALNGVQTSTGTTDTSMGDMRETMLAIYNDNFGENFEEIGAAMATVAQQTGLSGEALKKTTENALLLKDTFGLEVADSIKGANQVMKQFGVDSETAYNLIAQGAQSGLDSNGDLLDTLNEYSGTFKAQGFSAEEMFNMLSNASKSGIRDVDLAADAIKEFGIRSKDGSTTSAAGFEALGLSAAGMTKAFGAGGDTAKAAFEKTTTALMAMKDPVAQNAAGVALFGTQWEDLGVKGVAALVNTKGSISETTDALKKINEVKYNSFGESIEGIKRQLLTGIVLPLGEQVLPKMNEFATNIKTNMPAIQNEIKFAFSAIGTAIKEAATAISGIIDWFIKYKAIIVPIVGTVSAIVINAWVVTGIAATKTAIINGIASAKVVADWLLMGLKSTAHAITVVASWVATAAGAVKSVIVHVAQAGIVVAKWLWMGVESGIHALKVVASWALTGAGAIAAGIVMVAQSAIVVGKWAWMGLQSLLHAGKMAAAWVIAMGPIAWVTIAVVAIAALIAANWDAIKAKTIEIFTSVSTWLSTKWNEIKTDTSTKVDQIKADLSTKWEAIKTDISAKITSIQTDLSNKWTEIKTDISTKITEIKTDLSNKWNEIKTDISDKITAIKTDLSTKWEEIKTDISTKIDAVKSDLSTKWDQIKTDIAAKISAIKTDTIAKWEEIKTMVPEKVEELKAAAIAKFEALATKVGDVWTGIKTSIKETINSIIDIINGFINKVNSMKINVPLVNLPLGGSVGGYSIGMPQIPNIPLLAEGGIFDRPGTAIIAEAGAEAVLPISKLDGIIASALVKANKEIGMGKGIEQTNNFYSPTALTPSETARLNRNAMRELGLSF